MTHEGFLELIPDIEMHLTEVIDNVGVGLKDTRIVITRITDEGKTVATLLFIHGDRIEQLWNFIKINYSNYTLIEREEPS